MNWEIGIDMYTLMCIKWITNKNLLYKKIKCKNFLKNGIMMIPAPPTPTHVVIEIKLDAFIKSLAQGSQPLGHGRAISPHGLLGTRQHSRR